MKRHLIKPKKDGPRCPGLKKVIPNDVWTNKILPYYQKRKRISDIEAGAEKKKRKEKKRKRISDIEAG